MEGVCSGSDGGSYPNTDGEQWRLTGLVSSFLCLVACSQWSHGLLFSPDAFFPFLLKPHHFGQGEMKDTHRAVEQRHNTFIRVFFPSWVVVRSPDTIPRVNSLEKFKLLSYFYQIFPKLSLPWSKSHFLPSIHKLITHPRLSRGQSANAEWTPTAPEQHIQNSPMCFPSLEWSHQSSWSLSPGCELYIPEHGMFIQHARYLLGALCVQLDNVASQMRFSFSLSLWKKKMAGRTKPIKPVGTVVFHLNPKFYHNL